VDASQLFTAIHFASHQKTYEANGQYIDRAFGFRTDGTPTDDSVWYFFTDGPPVFVTLRPVNCQYFLLAPYLDKGLTVDDITTAIQTGWKMMGGSNAAVLSYHKETKLLIAVGDQEHLQVIQGALKALSDLKESPPSLSAGSTKTVEGQKP
jgi:hypothetical protein